MKKGIVFNIQKFCIHDGDGIRTCVFLKGCPLRCKWCHNPESFEKNPRLSFDKTKCSSCGRCLSECTARIIENGNMQIDRKKCTECGKCEKNCLNSANEIIGKEMTAEEYQIKSIDGKDYLLVQHKSGDYFYGGMTPHWYVFERKDN